MYSIELHTCALHLMIYRLGSCKPVCVQSVSSRATGHPRGPDLVFTAVAAHTGGLLGQQQLRATSRFPSKVCMRRTSLATFQQQKAMNNFGNHLQLGACILSESVAAFDPLNPLAKRPFPPALCGCPLLAELGNQSSNEITHAFDPWEYQSAAV